MTTIHVTRQPLRGALVLSGALTLMPVFLAASAPPVRLNDKDVKTLIEQVDQNRDAFKDNLDSSIKDAKFRSPSGEVDVSKYLDDYKDNVGKLKERFNSDYSASAELATVLRQATVIDNHMRNTGPATKGRSEWDREAASLRSLAEAYGTTFPTPDGASVRRLNDKETAQSADTLAKAADHFKDSVDKNSTVSKSDRDAAKESAEQVKKLADDVKSKTEDGKPATSEFDQLSSHYAKLQRWMDTHQAPTARADWEGMQIEMTKLRQAFNWR